MCKNGLSELKLEAKKGPVEYYVIDHVDKPSANLQPALIVLTFCENGFPTLSLQ
jgi:hypothetical protein